VEEGDDLDSRLSDFIDKTVGMHENLADGWILKLWNHTTALAKRFQRFCQSEGSIKNLLCPTKGLN
jgi:hypothetical protein